MQTNSAQEDIKCFVCKLPAHRDCYNADDVKLHLVYLCQVCLTAEKKEPTVEETTVPRKVDSEKEEQDDSEKEEQEAEASDSQQDTEDSEREDGDTTDNEGIRFDAGWMVKKKKKRKSKSVKIDKKETVCPLLIDGKCPHGISGKKCEYLHKNICFKYCALGTKEMHRGGCRFGDGCRWLHPTLCKNSVSMRMCLNETCTHVHLRYTKRTKPNGGRERGENRKPMNQRKYRDDYSQGYEQNKQRSGNYRREDQQSQYRSNTRHSQQHFLSQMVEKMQAQLATQIQREISKQFQRLQPQNPQETDEYNAQYPSMQDPMNPTWNQSQYQEW